MGHSSLTGVDIAPTEADGRDAKALGPSDSSDSGSDIAGAADDISGDPAEPVDVSLQRESLPIGTPDQRAHTADAQDISTDRVFTNSAEDEEDAAEERR